MDKEKERLTKFKNQCEDPILKVVQTHTAKISELEKQLQENRGLADLVIIEIKAVFITAITKL
jgi:hypothetical protein